MREPHEEAILRAAGAIDGAEALLIGAGAGMGVDSGMPDFRGPEGFWRAYPPYAKLGLRFEEMASPGHFATDPHLGWGFYGHRTNLYRQTPPHAGFALLREWGERTDRGAFVFTSNVDHHFQDAGFPEERVVECHGSVEWWQCLAECGAGIFPAGPGEIPVDPSTFRAVDPLPSCPRCGKLARPNILMFGDFGWDSRRTLGQHDRLASWFGGLDSARLAIVELGAGRVVPTVRSFCERTADAFGATLIRINVREPEVPTGHVGLAMGALDALRSIHERQRDSRGKRLDQG